MITTYDDILNEHRDFKIQHKRKLELFKLIMDNNHKDVEGEFHIFSSGNMVYGIFNTSQKKNRELRNHVMKILGVKKCKKSFNAGSGIFFWNMEKKMKDKHGTYFYDIDIKNVAPGKCKIIRKEVTKIIYETNCKG